MVVGPATEQHTSHVPTSACACDMSAKVSRWRDNGMSVVSQANVAQMDQCALMFQLRVAGLCVVESISIHGEVVTIGLMVK
jgi:hypothetical protein